MSYPSGYGIDVLDTVIGNPSGISDGEVLYWDTSTNKALGSPGFIFNDTLKQVILGVGSKLTLYNVYSDALNYERGGLEWRNNTLTLVSEKLGTGSQRFIKILPGGTGNGYLYVKGDIVPDVAAQSYIGTPSLKHAGIYAGGLAAAVPFVAMAHASQTANLQEWQNSSGTPLASVDKDGNVSTPKVVLGTVSILSGSGTPEAAVTAVIGSMYVRTDGGANTTLYVKESGTGNTGWVAK